MDAPPQPSPLGTRAIRAVAAVLVVAFAPSRASAVVVAPGAGADSPEFGAGYIASWGGASAVAVGERWLLSARHVGGGVGGGATLAGESFVADRIVDNRTEDLQLIHVDRALPGWHELATADHAVVPGQPVLLGGFGYRAGSGLADGTGYDWSGGPGEAWGRNRADQVGGRVLIRFDSPGSAAAEPREALFALSDSGGGLFTQGVDGVLRLAGIAVSTSSGFGSTRFGDYALAINIDVWSAWITATIYPGVPITSSQPPPAQGSYIPPPPPPRVPAPGTAAAFGFAVVCIAARRRR